MKRYSVVDEDSELVLKDATLKDVSDKFGISIGYASKCAIEGKKFKDRYSIYYTGSDEKQVKSDTTFADSWNDVRNKINAHYKANNNSYVLKTTA